jgi:hypothetical protein
MEDSAILWRVKLTNTSATKKTIRVSIDTDGVRRDAMGGVQLIARSQEFAMNAIYQFFDSPINGMDDARVEWELSLPPEQYREIRFFMKAGIEDDETQFAAPISWFESEWIRAKTVWEDRWNDALCTWKRVFSR